MTCSFWNKHASFSRYGHDDDNETQNYSGTFDSLHTNVISW